MPGIVPPNGYLADARRLCDEHWIVMIADEVMSGFGRCGEWFAISGSPTAGRSSGEPQGLLSPAPTLLGTPPVAPSPPG